MYLHVLHKFYSFWQETILDVYFPSNQYCILNNYYHAWFRCCFHIVRTGKKLQVRCCLFISIFPNYANYLPTVERSHRIKASNTSFWLSFSSTNWLHLNDNLRHEKSTSLWSCCEGREGNRKTPRQEEAGKGREQKYKIIIAGITLPCGRVQLAQWNGLN